MTGQIFLTTQGLSPKMFGNPGLDEFTINHPVFFEFYELWND